TPPCTQLQNVGEQRNRGIELSATFTPVETLALEAQINYVDIDNLSAPNIRVIGTPKYKYVLAGNWQFLPALSLRLDGQHESKRFSNSTGTRVADAFTVVNGFVRFAATSQVGVEVGVRNATDELYAYEEGFYEPGRTWLAQVDFKF